MTVCLYCGAEVADDGLAVCQPCEEWLTECACIAVLKRGGQDSLVEAGPTLPG